MNIRPYLPSARFAVLAVALLIGIGLVSGAAWITNPRQSGVQLQNTGGNGAIATFSDSDWQEAFASSTAFQTAATIQNQAEKLMEASRTNNLTDSIGRSLLINAAALQGQGLGDNQDQIVSSALAQWKNAQAVSSTYAVADLSTIQDSQAALHAYGNAIALVLTEHAQATYGNTMLPVSLAVDNNDPKTLSKLSAIAGEYRALAKDIAAIPVPKLLVDIELQIANNYMQMAAACLGMQTVLSDPARGLAALQNYASLFNQTEQLFIQMTEKLQSSRILFGSDEPGSVWAKLYAAAHQ